MLRAVRALVACLLVGLYASVAAPVSAQVNIGIPPPISLVVLETIGVADGQGAPPDSKPDKLRTTVISSASESLPQLQVHFIDVGQGDAILIDYGTVEVLIDGGPSSSPVASYIAQYVDGDLEVMVATHPHADHIGGLINVLQTFQVDKIYWNGEDYDSQTYRDFMAFASAEPESSLERLMRGDTIVIGGLAFDVLNPPDSFFTGINDNSLVLRLDYGDTSFLFEGDAELEAESNILANGLNVDVDILKVAHHGSNTSSTMPFLQAVSPQVAIYMAGLDNSYGHPHPETITALNQVGATVYGTDVNGTVVVSTDGQNYTVTPERAASAPVAIEISESVTIADSPGSFLPQSLTVSETITVADTSGTRLPVELVVDETISVSDSSTSPQPLSLNVSETIHVSDANNLPVPVALTINETITVSDSPGTNLPVTLIVNETVRVSDSFSTPLALSITVNETITVTDTPRIPVPLSITVTETIRVSDSFSTNQPVSIIVSETITVSDAPQTNMPVSVVVSEGVTVNDAITIPSQTMYTLSIDIKGSGVTEPPQGVYHYPSGRTVEITATPASGWRFVGWTGDASGSSRTITVIMNGHKSVTAVFVESGVVAISELQQNPPQYEGIQVKLSGVYRGWESGHGSPPVTRSDWVLQDETGAIYVTGNSLKLRYPVDVGTPVALTGYVRLKNQVVYIEVPK